MREITIDQMAQNFKNGPINLALSLCASFDIDTSEIADEDKLCRLVDEKNLEKLHKLMLLIGAEGMEIGCMQPYNFSALDDRFMCFCSKRKVMKDRVTRQFILVPKAVLGSNATLSCPVTNLLIVLSVNPSIPSRDHSATRHFKNIIKPALNRLGPKALDEINANAQLLADNHEEKHGETGTTIAEQKGDEQIISCPQINDFSKKTLGDLLNFLLSHVQKINHSDDAKHADRPEGPPQQMPYTVNVVELYKAKDSFLEFFEEEEKWGYFDKTDAGGINFVYVRSSNRTEIKLEASKTQVTLLFDEIIKWVLDSDVLTDKTKSLFIYENIPFSPSDLVNIVTSRELCLPFDGIMFNRIIKFFIDAAASDATKVEKFKALIAYLIKTESFFKVHIEQTNLFNVFNLFNGSDESFKPLFSRKWIQLTPKNIEKLFKEIGTTLSQDDFEDYYKDISDVSCKASFLRAFLQINAQSELSYIQAVVEKSKELVSLHQNQPLCLSIAQLEKHLDQGQHEEKSDYQPDRNSTRKVTSLAQKKRKNNGMRIHSDNISKIGTKKLKPLFSNTEKAKLEAFYDAEYIYLCNQKAGINNKQKYKRINASIKKILQMIGSKIRILNDKIEVSALSSEDVKEMGNVRDFIFATLPHCNKGNLPSATQFLEQLEQLQSRHNDSCKELFFVANRLYKALKENIANMCDSDFISIVNISPFAKQIEYLGQYVTRALNSKTAMSGLKGEHRKEYGTILLKISCLIFNGDIEQSIRDLISKTIIELGRFADSDNLYYEIFDLRNSKNQDIANLILSAIYPNPNVHFDPLRITSSKEILKRGSGLTLTQDTIKKMEELPSSKVKYITLLYWLSHFDDSLSSAISTIKIRNTTRAIEKRVKNERVPMVKEAFQDQEQKRIPTDATTLRINLQKKAKETLNFEKDPKISMFFGMEIRNNVNFDIDYFMKLLPMLKSHNFLFEIGEPLVAELAYTMFRNARKGEVGIEDLRKYVNCIEILIKYGCDPKKKHRVQFPDGTPIEINAMDACRPLLSIASICSEVDRCIQLLESRGVATVCCFMAQGEKDIDFIMVKSMSLLSEETESLEYEKRTEILEKLHCDYFQHSPNYYIFTQLHILLLAACFKQKEFINDMLDRYVGRITLNTQLWLPDDIVSAIHRRKAELSFKLDFDLLQSYYTLLHFAALNGWLGIVGQILEFHAPKDPEFTASEWHPIHLACQNGHIEIVRMLIEKDGSLANMRTRDDKKLTPLHIAASNLNKSLVEELLSQHGADTKLKSKGKTATAFALEKGRKEGRLDEGRAIVKLILRPHSETYSMAGRVTLFTGHSPERSPEGSETRETDSPQMNM